jgi:hypothetical protein
MKFFKMLRQLIVEKVFGKIIREYKYRKRIKELRKRDPFIY